jgi:hypothetical protein
LQRGAPGLLEDDARKVAIEHKNLLMDARGVG